ncbi:MAG: aspartate carbamoyltransferase catalytic subunit [Bacteroidia bacterium]|nr:aspartate carbamoyltransferase catalytic subunit [Bacteroidia bacterium]MDW8334004.1 aspartate carbamoyltransferase catalytic subunit [Bacteroidia bacterium]
MELSVKHLLAVKDLTRDDVETVFSMTDYFLERVLSSPSRKAPGLRDVTVVNAFFENSTRTKLSFELAAKRLGADVVNFSASGSSVAKGETLLDTMRNLLAMKMDVVVVRHRAAGAAHFLARRLDAVVVNAGDGAHEHPTQALLDCYTLARKFGRVEGLRVAVVGDVLHSRVALSDIFALKLLGAEVRLCAPPTLLPRYVESLGASVSYELEPTLRWCDAAIFLRIQRERQHAGLFPSTREYVARYGLDQRRLESLNPNLFILHPGPVNRGVELTGDAADGPRSLILDQVLHGVAVRMAVLYLLVGKRGG